MVFKLCVRVIIYLALSYFLQRTIAFVVLETSNVIVYAFFHIGYNKYPENDEWT